MTAALWPPQIFQLNEEIRDLLDRIVQAYQISAIAREFTANGLQKIAELQQQLETIFKDNLEKN